MPCDTVVTGTEGQRWTDECRRLVFNKWKAARSFAPQLTEAQQLMQNPNSHSEEVSGAM